MGTKPSRDNTQFTGRRRPSRQAVKTSAQAQPKTQRPAMASALLASGGARATVYLQ